MALDVIVYLGAGLCEELVIRCTEEELAGERRTRFIDVTF